MGPESLSFPLSSPACDPARVESPAPTFRDEVAPGDAAAVGALVSATGFFSAEESAIAVELVEDYLKRGRDSGYRFIFAKDAGRLAGYVCFGPIPLTRVSFDLYWIAVQPDLQRTGLGRRLLTMAEATARDLGGASMYVDTSSRAQYAPTRLFYRRLGYRLAAEFPDFYAPGDGKVVFVKRLTS